MKVAVITAYYKEDVEMLRRCHSSVLRQTYPCTHVLVADGHPREEVSDWDAQHMILPRSHGDYGNTPRGLGSISALNQGFEAFAYLDADNWYHERHVESLVELCRSKQVDVAFSSRQIILSDGDVCPHEDKDVVERRHVDTNCFFITDKAAFLLPMWAMLDPRVSAAGDRLMLRAVRRHGVRHQWTDEKTVFYESRWPNHFRAMGKTPPDDAHHIDWAKVRASYSRRRMIERLTYDPIA